jgi:hypothetical protein
VPTGYCRRVLREKGKSLEASSTSGTRDAGRPPAGAGGTAGSDPDRSGAEALARIGAGAAPNSMREELLRDIVSSWSRLHPDHAAWDVAGAMLAAASALADRAPCGGGAAAAVAMAELAGAIEECVHAGSDAPARARAALERFLTLIPPSPDAAAAAG